MRVTFIFGILLSLTLVSCATNREDKVLYVCTHDEVVRLTGDGSLGCPEYNSGVELATVPDGATWADVEWAVGLLLADRPSPAQQRAEERFEQARSDSCGKWLDLSLQRHVTVGIDTDKEAEKWQYLSRIVPDTNLCDEYMRKQVMPRF